MTLSRDHSLTARRCIEVIKRLGQNPFGVSTNVSIERLDTRSKIRKNNTFT